MFCYVKNNFLYINVPRNGSNTHGTFLQKNGWEKHNLFENRLDLSNMVMWGHITNPEHRHTKGLAMYIRAGRSGRINIDDPKIAEILVSGVFDEHTCSINMMLGALMRYPIHWIPLDVTITNFLVSPPVQMKGNDLTNSFFNEYNLNLQVTESDTKNTLAPGEAILREKINKCKEIYNLGYQQIVKNFLEPDILLYNKTVQYYRDKYCPKEST